MTASRQRDGIEVPNPYPAADVLREDTWRPLMGWTGCFPGTAG